MRLRSSVLLLAAAGLIGSAATASAAEPVPAGTSPVADTTPPVLALSSTATESISNVGLRSTVKAGRPIVWTIKLPRTAATSPEDTTMTFTVRDAFTGQLRGRASLFVPAGDPRTLPAGWFDDPTAPSAIPVSNVPCEPGTPVTCGLRHRLPIFSLLRIEVRAADAAGNVSRPRAFYAVVTPNVVQNTDF